MKIYLFTAPVHSGKTTTLMNWLADKENIGGILAPDIDGLRHLCDLRSRDTFPFQIPDGDLGKVAVVNICKYNFYRSAFELAQDVLLDSLEEEPDWLIIDEIGKLELKGQGLEPAAGKVIAYYQLPETKGKLLLVVRDSLVTDAVEHYGIKEYEIVKPDSELFQKV